MKKLFWATAITLLSTTSVFAADITGNWEIRQHGKPAAIVTMSQSSQGTYNGVVTSETAKKPSGIVGKTIITGLKANGGGKYSGGKIIDPTTGNAFKLNATVNGNVLKLHGSLTGNGLGASQTWYRK